MLDVPDRNALAPAKGHVLAHACNQLRVSGLLQLQDALVSLLCVPATALRADDGPLLPKMVEAAHAASTRANRSISALARRYFPRSAVSSLRRSRIISRAWRTLEWSRSNRRPISTDDLPRS